MPVDLEHLMALAEWDTPALSNALDLLRLRSFNGGYTDGSIQRIAGTAVGAPMIGRVYAARHLSSESYRRWITRR
jgi:hypothetical protein